jgi:hypothetical protein
MDPFNPTATQGAPYPASSFARSALPSPQEGQPSVAGMPEGQRKHVGIIVAVFVVLGVLLFHWHFNRS